jgi:hypothetical protein
MWGARVERVAPMTTRIGSILLMVATLVIPGRAFARWERPQDNKPVAELEGMSMDALLNEALDVCLERVLLSHRGDGADPSGAAEATAYLEVIADVVGERKGGANAAWMRTLLRAHTAKECQRGLHGFLTPHGREDGRPVPERTRSPRVRRDQLPPWLAPR